VEGDVTPADVIGPNGQGIEPGSFGEILSALRAGHAYANIHTTRWPGVRSAARSTTRTRRSSTSSAALALGGEAAGLGRKRLDRGSREREPVDGSGGQVGFIQSAWADTGLRNGSAPGRCGLPRGRGRASPADAGAPHRCPRWRNRRRCRTANRYTGYLGQSSELHLRRRGDRSRRSLSLSAVQNTSASTPARPLGPEITHGESAFANRSRPASASPSRRQGTVTTRSTPASA